MSGTKGAKLVEYVGGSSKVAGSERGIDETGRIELVEDKDVQRCAGVVISMSFYPLCVVLHFNCAGSSSASKVCK